MSAAAAAWTWAPPTASSPSSSSAAAPPRSSRVDLPAPRGLGLGAAHRQTLGRPSTCAPSPARRPARDSRTARELRGSAVQISSGSVYDLSPAWLGQLRRRRLRQPAAAPARPAARAGGASARSAAAELLCTNQLDLVTHARPVPVRPLFRLDGTSGITQWWIPNAAGHRQMLRRRRVRHRARSRGLYSDPVRARPSATRRRSAPALRRTLAQLLVTATAAGFRTWPCWRRPPDCCRRRWSALLALPEDGGCSTSAAGRRPVNRADWVIDLMPYATRGRAAARRVRPCARALRRRRAGSSQDICSHEPWPFADGFFDFAICTFTLEDVRDPVGSARRCRAWPAPATSRSRRCWTS